MVMDIQTRKDGFIEEYLRITDESLLDKLSDLLRKKLAKRQKRLCGIREPAGVS